MATDNRNRRRQGTRRSEPQPTWRRLAGRLPLIPLAIGVAALGLLGLSPGGETIDRLNFPIRSLKIESAFERLAADEIAAAVAPLAAAGFFDTSVGDVKDALIAMPWVRSAEVRRIWPDTLQITVIEEQAAARWEDRGLLNPAGEPFDPGPSDDRRLAGLPLLAGPPGTSQQVMQQYLRLSARLQPLDLEIRSLRMDPRRAWELTIENGMTLVLGRRDAGLQVERFVRFYPGVIAARTRDINEVDLRYPNGFAVRWKPADTAGAGGNTGVSG